MKPKQTYDPVEVESGWYDFWVERDLFAASEHSDKPPYTIVIPPPNVTGSLHMGHALFVTLQDLLIRWKRMQGYEALWLPGTDHAGIATQVVVERLLRQEGTDRHALGREAFLERVWQWKAQSGGRITQQLKRLGASCDWSRERFTMDEGLSLAVRELFVRMVEDGLIYRGERMVDWDPKTQTVLSGLEVLSEQESGKFWYLRYPLADGSGHIVVGTTRPETMLGDTAVAVHPQDPRYQGLIGKLVALPLTQRLIPIIADDVLPDPQKGSGAVKVTPSHDPNDFACGQRHGLERIDVIGLDARMTDACPAEFVGLDRYDARKLVIERFEALGLLEKVEDILYSPGRSERSGVIVEPLVMKQWFVRGEPLAKPALEAVAQGRTRIVPELWRKTYDHFLNHIQDWCISRQLWWGHQIPAWYCGDCGEVLVARSAPEACSSCGGTSLRQDEDVLDTWFSSALWPFSTMGWPEQTQTLKKFYPTQVLETGSDILFFWVARMMMMGLYVMGEVPFEDVYLHAIVRDANGDKMSKVKGNVIDPLHMIYGARVEDLDPELHRELIKRFPEGVKAQGADALRFTLAILAAQGRDIKLDVSRMEGYRAFLNKVWNAAQFALGHLADLEPAPYAHYVGGSSSDEAPMDVGQLSLADRWILTRLHQTVEQVTRRLEEYAFNEAADALYHFVWHEYCDWYLEFSKPTLYDAQGPARQATQATLSYTLDVILRALHPLCPYITEDIWQSLPRGQGAPVSVMVAAWPVARPSLMFEQEAQSVELARALIEAVRSIRGESGVKPGVSIKQAYLVAEPEATRDALGQVRDYITRQARIEALHIASPQEPLELGAVATAVVSGVEVRIPLKGLIDVEEELARLRKEIKRVEADIAFVQGKLNNPRFVDKAPQEIVQKERDKLAGLEQELAALRGSLAQIEALATS